MSTEATPPPQQQPPQTQRIDLGVVLRNVREGCTRIQQFYDIDGPPNATPMVSRKDLEKQIKPDIKWLLTELDGAWKLIFQMKMVNDQFAAQLNEFKKQANEKRIEVVSEAGFHRMLRGGIR